MKTREEIIAIIERSLQAAKSWHCSTPEEAAFYDGNESALSSLIDEINENEHPQLRYLPIHRRSFIMTCAPANAATLYVPTTPAEVTLTSIIAVYSNECDLDAGPRILRTFAPDETELAWACFDEHTSTGRLMNYRWLHGDEAASAERLREIYLDALFDSQSGVGQRRTAAALEAAWSFVAYL